MVIQQKTPLTFAEVSDIVGDGEKAKKIKDFVKKMQDKPLGLDKAKALREELKSLNLLKLKDEHIVKIVDFLPEDPSDLSKIIPEVSLDQDEVNKILEVVKKH